MICELNNNIPCVKRTAHASPYYVDLVCFLASGHSTCEVIPPNNKRVYSASSAYRSVIAKHTKFKNIKVICRANRIFLKKEGA